MKRSAISILIILLFAQANPRLALIDSALAMGEKATLAERCASQADAIARIKVIKAVTYKEHTNLHDVRLSQMLTVEVIEPIKNIQIDRTAAVAVTEVPDGSEPFKEGHKYIFHLKALPTDLLMKEYKLIVC